MGEGEGGMIWENGIETCILSYVKRIASPGSMHDTGDLGLGHWDDPEGWSREGSGKGIQGGEHVYTRGKFMSCQYMEKPLQYCKVTSLQLNKLKKNPPAMQETWV